MDWVSILIIKANEMHNYSNLFDTVHYMFRTGPLPIIRSISTLYTQQQVADVNRTNMTSTYCCVYSVETPDDGQWTCPKHVEYFIKSI